MRLPCAGRDVLVVTFQCDILASRLLHFGMSVCRLSRTQAFILGNCHHIPTASKNIIPCSYSVLAETACVSASGNLEELY
jgi:hypothetical protein